MSKVSNIRLRKRLIQILKTHEGDMPSASTLYDMVIESGMSSSLAGSHNRIAQLCRTTGGISSMTTRVRGTLGDTYTAEVYYLESEEAFKSWVASKMG